MLNILLYIKKHVNTLVALLPLFAFAAALVWLYFLDAASFELMWKGRTFQLFFVWLISLELILGWENLQTSKITKLKSPRTLIFAAVLLLPLVYVAISYYFGLNAAIEASTKQMGVQWANSMPLSIEYLVFAVISCLIAFLAFGAKGLKSFSVPILFLIIVGALYTIDNVYPYGEFTPFQILVPTTATLAGNVLSSMGYNVNLNAGVDYMPQLTAIDPIYPLRRASFAIAWPCAGIESLLIFTVVILLFLKRMQISWKAKIGYFAVGAAITYMINILRIVTIFNIALDFGVDSQQVQSFHFYYGPLYAVTWVVAYPLIVIGSQSLWNKLVTQRNKARLPKNNEEKTAVP